MRLLNGIASPHPVTSVEVEFLYTGRCLAWRWEMWFHSLHGCSTRFSLIRISTLKNSQVEKKNNPVEMLNPSRNARSGLKKKKKKERIKILILLLAFCRLFKRFPQAIGGRATVRPILRCPLCMVVVTASPWLTEIVRRDKNIFYSHPTRTFGTWKKNTTFVSKRERRKKQAQTSVKHKNNPLISMLNLDQISCNVASKF